MSNLIFINQLGHILQHLQQYITFCDKVFFTNNYKNFHWIFLQEMTFKEKMELSYEHVFID
jgi:hypothetical protein